MLANLISKQTLVHSIGPHAQCILQSQVHCKRGETLPQSPDALFLDDSLTTMPDACKPGVAGASLGIYTAYTQQRLHAQYHTFILANMVKLQSCLDDINGLQTACLSSPSDGACMPHTMSNGATTHLNTWCSEPYVIWSSPTGKTFDGRMRWFQWLMVTVTGHPAFTI